MRAHGDFGRQRLDSLGGPRVSRGDEGVAFVSERFRCSSWTESYIGVSLALEYARDRAKHRP